MTQEFALLGKVEEGRLKRDPKAALSLAKLMHSSRPASNDDATQRGKGKPDV